MAMRKRPAVLSKNVLVDRIYVIEQKTSADRGIVKTQQERRRLFGIGRWEDKTCCKEMEALSKMRTKQAKIQMSVVSWKPYGVLTIELKVPTAIRFIFWQESAKFAQVSVFIFRISWTIYEDLPQGTSAVIKGTSTFTPSWSASAEVQRCLWYCHDSDVRWISLIYSVWRWIV